MASLTVHSSTPVTTHNSIPVENDSSNEDFWSVRSVQNGLSCFTSAQIEVVSWRVFGAAVLLGAGALVGLAAFEIIALPVALLAIPALFLASYSFWQSTQIDDYEDEGQLTQLREEAQRMTLDQVAARHSWDLVFKHSILTPIQFSNHYRRQVQDKSINDIMNYYERVQRHAEPYVGSGTYSYTVPHPREHSQKWRPETRNFTFEQIITQYSLEKLDSYSLIDRAEYVKINELKGIYTTAQSTFRIRETAANADFERTVAPMRATLNRALRAADDLYSSNWAVRELQTIDNRALQARMQITNDSTSRIQEARERHQREISQLSTAGVLVYDRLSTQDRARHDLSVAELHRAERLVGQDTQRRLSEHDLRHATERQRLVAEEARVRGTRDQMKRDAQTNFDHLSEPANQTRENTLQPYREEFQRIAGDLNHRYRAFIRQLETIR